MILRWTFFREGFINYIFRSIGLCKPKLYLTLERYWISRWHYVPYPRLSLFWQQMYQEPPNLHRFLLCITVFYVAYRLTARVFRAEVLRNPASRFLSYFGHRFTLNRQFRSRFRDLRSGEASPFRGHSHGKTASARTSARTLLMKVASQCGLMPNVHQQASVDQKHSIHGSRNYFWAKDTACEYKPHVNAPNECDVLVDTDYYIDMNKFLRPDAPVLLYTVTPSEAAKSGETSYKFKLDGDKHLISFTVSGGGTFEHELWKYDMDSLCVVRQFTKPILWPLQAFLWFLDIPWSATTYNVDHHFLGLDHSLIAITPIVHYGLASAWLATVLETARLQRLTPITPSSSDESLIRYWTKLGIRDKDGYKVSIAPSQRSDQDEPYYGSATIDGKLYQNLVLLDSNSKQGVTPSSAQLALYKVCGGDTQSANILTAEIRASSSMGDSITLPHIEIPDKSYRVIPKGKEDLDVEYDPKPGVHPFMHPIVDGAFNPQRNRSNDERCVKKRITEVAACVPMTTATHRYATEFVRKFTDFVVNTTGLLCPLEEDVVRDRQPRPTQQRILDVAEEGLRSEDPEVQAHQKGESYGNIKDPRNISTVEPSDKMEYSKVMYAFSEALKKFPWYAFSRTPKNIARKVTVILQQVANELPDECGTYGATLGDFSRMDGRIAEVIRTFEEMLMTAIFQPQYRSRILDLMSRQHNLRGRTKHGVKYATLWSRISGSSETSGFNSLATAWILYISYRLMGLNSSEAWRRLETCAIVGGDDSLAVGVDPACFEKAATMVGQVLTVDTIALGETGVNFLSRYYGPAAWFGSTNNMCDLPRALAKFHVTGSIPLDPVEKLVQKALSMSMSDRNTPIIGPFVTKVLKLAKGRGMSLEFEYDKRIHSWWAQFCADHEIYDNEEADWMYLHIDRIPGFNTIRFEKWLKEVESLEAMLFIPSMCDPVEPQQLDEVVVIGETVLEPVETGPDESPETLVLKCQVCETTNPKHFSRNQKEKAKTKPPKCRKCIKEKR